jgi:hypothetical protein
MKRLLVRVPACEVPPRGFGLVYVDYLRMESIHALVPLNLLLGLVRAAWLWLLHGYYTTGMARRERYHATRRGDGVRAGILLRWGSLWVGAHWSRANRRLCINLVPCVTLWITAPGGVTP